MKKKLCFFALCLVLLLNTLPVLANDPNHLDNILSADTISGMSLNALENDLSNGGVTIIRESDNGTTTYNEDALKRGANIVRTIASGSSYSGNHDGTVNFTYSPYSFKNGGYYFEGYNRFHVDFYNNVTDAYIGTGYPRPVSNGYILDTIYIQSNSGAYYAKVVNDHDYSIAFTRTWYGVAW